MPCPQCGKEPRPTCGLCGGRGYWEIDQCYGAFLDEMTWEVSHSVEQLEAGLGWPDGGNSAGWMQQPASLVQAIRLFKRVRNER
jgi:hypothetical protein